MSLSGPEAARRADLIADVRRMKARAARYQRLSNEYKVRQVEAELAIGAMQLELKRFDDLRQSR